jgi:hypothetical protein
MWLDEEEVLERVRLYRASITDPENRIISLLPPRRIRPVQIHSIDLVLYYEILYDLFGFSLVDCESASDFL